MAVPSIGKGRAGRHSGTHGVGSLLRDLNLPTSHSGMVCVVCRVRSMKACALANTDPPKQGARTRTWCKECDLAMCSPARLLQRLPQPAHQAPLHRHGPRGQEAPGGRGAHCSTRTGGRKEYKKKAQSY
eukprot:jgi/Mesvir1/4099/Mv06651-RA.1